MSKEARALLKKINDKKNAIKSLVNKGKTKEAKEAKAVEGRPKETASGTGRQSRGTG